MARELTPEQIAARRKNQQQSEESGGNLGDGAFLENWKPDEGKVNSIDVIVHTGIVVHEIHRHAYKEAVLVTPKGKPSYRMLLTRYVRCNETEQWHRFLRMKKEQMEVPKCLFERLINHLATRIDRTPAFKDEILFRFGVGCVNKEGTATPVEEFTAGDICDMTGGRHGWKKNLSATQRRLMVVVPWRTNDGAKVYGDASPKIVMESYKLINAFIKEKERAMGRFGDEADPAAKAAVYRFTADRTNPKSFGPDFTVSFLNEVNPDDLPDAVQNAWADDLPANLQDEIKAVLAPNNPGTVLRHFQDALIADLDLEKVCGYSITVAPAQRERDAAPASDDYARGDTQRTPPASGSTAAGSVAAKPSGRRLPPPEPVGEPCQNCETPWPAGMRECPGKDGPKRCRAFDDTVEPDDDDGLPF